MARAFQGPHKVASIMKKRLIRRLARASILIANLGALSAYGGSGGGPAS